MSRRNLAAAVLGAAALVAPVPASAQDVAPRSFRDAGTDPVRPPLAESAASIPPERFGAYLDRLEAVEAVKRLIASFAYFRSANLPEETAALFQGDGSVDFDGGKWVGRTSLQRLFEGRFRLPELVGTRGPQHGILNEIYVAQSVIDVAADGQSASARFREIRYTGVQRKYQDYGASLYEAVFTRRAGVWAIQSLTPCVAWQLPYTGDLSKAPLPEYPKRAPDLFPKVADGPDRLSSQLCVPWPYGGITPPMHYPHPVTGEFINKP